MTSNKLVKAVETHRLAAVVHEGGYTILIAMVVAMAMRIITFVVMVMTVAMWVVAFVVMVLIIVMMMMSMLVVMVVMVVVMMMLLLHVALYLLNPCSRSGYLFEIKELGVENLAKRHIAIIALDDFCFGLDSANNGNYLLSFRFANF